MSNIAYSTPEIAKFFRVHRRRWDDFYPSERWVIEEMARQACTGLGNVLDIGCACGGLGAALAERKLLDSYVGIDISAQAIAAARAANDIRVPCEFFEGDASMSVALKDRVFDTVFNLSCADWNVETLAIIEASWRHVRPNGRLIISLRLTNQSSAIDMQKCFQYIHYGDAFAIPPDAERAAYVVLNVNEALSILCALHPSHVLGFGYWGSPSATARTPFSRIAFTVFSATKGAADTNKNPVLELRVPSDLWHTPAL